MKMQSIPQTPRQTDVKPKAWINLKQRSFSQESRISRGKARRNRSNRKKGKPGKLVQGGRYKPPVYGHAHQHKGSAGNDAKTRALHHYAGPIVNPISEKPVRGLTCGRPTALYDNPDSVTMTMFGITPYGYTYLPEGEWPIFAYKDVCRALIRPIINPPPASAHRYNWIFMNTTLPVGNYADTDAGSGIRNGEAVVYDTFHMSVEPLVATSYAVSGQPILLPVMAAVPDYTTSTLPLPHGPMLYGACIYSDGSPDVSQGAYMFNGGECIQVGVACSNPIPAGHTLRVSFDLVKYVGGGMRHAVLGRFNGADGISESECFIVCEASATPSNYTYFTMNTGPYVYDQTTADADLYHRVNTPAYSLYTGYLGVRILGYSLTKPSGDPTWDPGNIQIKVSQAFPTMAILNTATGAFSQNGSLPYDANTRSQVQLVHPPGGLRVSWPSAATPATSGVRQSVIYPHAPYVCYTHATTNYILSGATSMRTNAAAVLVTNVTKYANLEGTVHSCAFSDSSDWSGVSVNNLKSMAMTKQGYTGTLDKGAYTWFRPEGSTSTDSQFVQLGSYSTPWGPLPARYPMIRLSDRTPLHVVLLVDTDISTTSTFLVRWNYHLEFTADSNGAMTFEDSTMTAAAHDEVYMVLLRAAEFTENWIHVTQLWNAIKRGASIALHAGMGAAARAAISEIASGLALVAL